MSQPAKANWTSLLETAVKDLNRSDTQLLVKALAGTVGMIACFPGQMTGPATTTSNSTGKPTKGQLPPKEKKSKGAVPQATNPLHGTEIAKAFNESKKIVHSLKKRGEDIPQEVLNTLNERKKTYFEALASAKGSSNASAGAESKEIEAPASAEGSIGALANAKGSSKEE
jgi:hypothetical protein